MSYITTKRKQQFRFRDIPDDLERDRIARKQQAMRLLLEWHRNERAKLDRLRLPLNVKARRLHHLDATYRYRYSRIR